MYRSSASQLHLHPCRLSIFDTVTGIIHFEFLSHWFSLFFCAERCIFGWPFNVYRYSILYRWRMHGIHWVPPIFDVKCSVFNSRKMAQFNGFDLFAKTKSKEQMPNGWHTKWNKIAPIDVPLGNIEKWKLFVFLFFFCYQSISEIERKTRKRKGRIREWVIEKKLETSLFSTTGTTETVNYLKLDTEYGKTFHFMFSNRCNEDIFYQFVFLAHSFCFVLFCSVRKLHEIWTSVDIRYCYFQKSGSWWNWQE